jgi:hypothetical protein
LIKLGRSRRPAAESSYVHVLSNALQTRTITYWYHVAAVAAAIRGRRSEGRGQSEERVVRSRSPTLCRLLFCLAGHLFIAWHGSSVRVSPLWNKSSAESHSFIFTCKPTWSSPPKINKLNKQQKIDELLRMGRLPLAGGNGPILYRPYRPPFRCTQDGYVPRGEHTASSPRMDHAIAQQKFEKEKEARGCVYGRSFNFSFGNSETRS